MADDDENGGATASIFSEPPSYFWTDFTPDRLERLEALQAEYSSQTGATVSAATRLPNIPDDLVNLQPPPEPSDGEWRIFGDKYTLEDALPTLEAQGITRLGPDPVAPPSAPNTQRRIDAAFELKKLAKSLLLNFLELAGIMGLNPADGAAKLEDLRTLFINMHHGINAWRPHQTREALISLLQTQLEHTDNETKALREVTESARRVLEGLGSVETPEGGGINGVPGGDEVVVNGAGSKRGKGKTGVLREDGWADLDVLL